jgi:hypothetical protein
MCIRTIQRVQIENKITVTITLPMQSVPITTDVVTSTRSGRGVRHYVIHFVSDLRQVGGVIRVLQFPLPIKLTATYIPYSECMCIRTIQRVQIENKITVTITCYLKCVFPNSVIIL